VTFFSETLEFKDEFQGCDLELSECINELPDAACNYSNEDGIRNSAAPLLVNKTLLHIAYITTLSILHRPQIPLVTTTRPNGTGELYKTLRKKVWEASKKIIHLSQGLHARDLDRYLPATRITVVLLAISIHLLDIKTCKDDARQAAIDGFCQWMAVLEKLRDKCISADFGLQLLRAAIRKQDTDIMIRGMLEKLLQEQPIVSLYMDKIGEIPRRSERAIQTLSLYDDGVDRYVHNTISAYTPLSENVASHDQLFKDESELTAGNNASGDVDLNHFINFDSVDENWNDPLLRV
jgi:hypothetical protein